MQGQYISTTRILNCSEKLNESVKAWSAGFVFFLRSFKAASLKTAVIWTATKLKIIFGTWKGGDKFAGLVGKLNTTGASASKNVNVISDDNNLRANDANCRQKARQSGTFSRLCKRDKNSAWDYPQILGGALILHTQRDSKRTREAHCKKPTHSLEKNFA